MRRRDFIKGVAGSATAWPLAARAQQPPPTIGFLRNTSLSDSMELVAAFRLGLKEAGYIENQNVAVKYRWANNQNDQLPRLVGELLHPPVAIILAGGIPAAFAAKTATQSIPIVFSIGGDPVRIGLVTSLNQPGGNVTGVAFLSTTTFLSKRLELLSELLSGGVAIAFLGNPSTPNGLEEIHAVDSLAESSGRKIAILNAASERDLEPVFTKLTQLGAGALVIGGDALFLSRRNQLVALAARYAIPTSYQLREFAVAGGLMSYGTSIADTYRQAGVYAGRILKGEKPADLPVLLPTKFELVINLKTAKALGLNIPPTLLALADEVIE
jgi:putative tryptophan/tyrosine transport system substrate-binding protein